MNRSDLSAKDSSALLTRIDALLEPASILLTAAHCAGNFIDGVLMGGTSLDGSSSTLIPVATELPHPGYGRYNEFLSTIRRTESSDAKENCTSFASTDYLYSLGLIQILSRMTMVRGFATLYAFNNRHRISHDVRTLLFYRRHVGQVVDTIHGSSTASQF
jgi:hypothetical protein